MKVIRKLVSSASALRQFLYSLNCPIIHISGQDDEVYCFFDTTSGNETGFEVTSTQAYHYLHGVSTQTGTISFSSVAEITVCYSDTFFYIQLQNSTSAATPSTRYRNAYIYDELDDGTLFGWKGQGTSTSSVSFYDLSTFNIRDIANGDTVCTYTSVVTKAANTGLLFYTDHVMIISDSVRLYEDTKLTSSSTVPINAVYTFDRRNYFAVGANILVPIDS